MAGVTHILSQIESGDPAAAEQLLPLVYDELRRLAAAKIAHEKPGQTLQATALVHEAYVRLVDVETAQHWENRRHFDAAAAEAMRRILVETVRRKRSRRHGGEYQRQDLAELDLPAKEISADLLALDTALQKLAAIDQPAAEIVQLRFFAGLALPEVAKLLEISPRTADRLWAYAKAFLLHEIQEGKPTGQDSRPIVA
jgi:RNA polymerase sigma factor (TIGR02999 family)